MRVQFAPEFVEKVKHQEVRIRKSLKRAIQIFTKDPLDPELDNHELKREWKGFRSIDVAADYRAIYEELNEDGAEIAYFVALGTHAQLYRKVKK